jgi:hypothetical protein
MLPGYRVGGPFGALVKHVGSFDQFLSMGHGNTSTQVHNSPMYGYDPAPADQARTFDVGSPVQAGKVAGD